MDISNVRTNSVVFGNRNIHAKITKLPLAVSLQLFGLSKPNIDNHHVEDDEIQCYLFGMAFLTEESVDVVISWLNHVKRAINYNTNYKPCYSNENQEGDYE
jgi:hypothetical protein